MTRRLAALVLGCTVLAARPASAQTGELDQRMASRVDSVFSRFTAPGFPGCALGVVQDGRLAYAKGFGLASIELGVPITPATVFDIGSVSKQFTAMSIVLLAQDGKLSLNDEIQKYLPEIPRYARPVTLRHLLHHTSGIRDYIAVLYASGLQDESVTGDREALEAIVRQRDPNFESGAEHRYSNSGYFLLSLVVQKVSGRTLRDFAAERIFVPLGMTHSQFVNRHDQVVPGKAASYSADRPSGFRLALANWEQTGDGAVNTTIEDLLLWEQNFHSRRVGGAAAIRELETTGVLNDGKAISYAKGLVVDRRRGLREVSHGGSWAGFRAFLARFPEQRTSVMVLCNVGNAGPGPLAHRVADLLLADHYTEAAVAPVFTPFQPAGAVADADKAPALPLSAYVGRYRSDELLADWQIVQVRDSLRIRIGLVVEGPVTPQPDGSFVAADFPIRFLLTAGQVTGLSITNRGARALILTKAIP